MAIICGLFVSATALAQLQVENLGEPVRTEVPIEFVTRDSRTGSIAWAGYSGADRYGVVGIQTETGAVTEVDLSSYGKTNTAVLVFKHNDRQLFIFAGNPGRFFRYDIRQGKLTRLGEPTKATFWHKQGAVTGCSGNIYVGTYPRATVVELNTKTGSVKLIEQIADDTSLDYVGQPACASDGQLYFPVGMPKGQLWSYNPATGEKRQILPESLQTYGYAVLWQGNDGRVYGEKDTAVFVCDASGIRPAGKVKPPAVKKDNEIKGKIAVTIDKDGRLVLKDMATRKNSFILTSFLTPAAGLYSLGDVHGGKLFGSSFKPGSTFTFDLRTRKFEDHGVLTTGKIQVYDYLSHEQGVFMCSYTGGHIDLYPAGKELVIKNRKHIVNLHATENQERPRQLATGPDGMVYCVSRPLKGMLGGRLTRIDPKTLAVTSYKDTELIPHQSYASVTTVPETGELFITASTGGGTGARAITTETYVFLWDTKTASVSHRAQPLPGVSTYGNAVRAPNGILYGFSGNRYYAFDPRQRKTIFTGVLERTSANANAHVMLSERPAPDGLLYGVDAVSGHIIVIDPADHSIRVLGGDPSLKNTRFAGVYADGYLYYGYHSALMRVKVSPPGTIK